MTKALAAALDLGCYLETPDGNPFLADFYVDPVRWALANQTWFLLQTARHHRQIATGKGGVQDHSIYETVEVYGRALYDHGALTHGEFELLHRTLLGLTTELPPPQVVVLLETPVEVLLERIALRQRSYEAGIDADYLSSMQQARQQLFAKWRHGTVLRIDSTTIQIPTAESVGELADQIRPKLL